jgi:hypothetical protein
MCDAALCNLVILTDDSKELSLFPSLRRWCWSKSTRVHISTSRSTTILILVAVTTWNVTLKTVTSAFISVYPHPRKVEVATIKPFKLRPV